MPRAAVPRETDLLCEACGYTLNGLPDGGNCPECGVPTALSLADDGRSLSGFEQRPGASSFLATTLAVLLRPGRFYRALQTRVSHPAAEWFAQRHRLIAAFLFTSAALGHWLWIERISPAASFNRNALGTLLVYLVAAVLLYYFMGAITRLAAWLSSLEGAYWGMRLPLPVVRRCLQFHTAAYLPVAVLANAIVWGYRWLLQAGVLAAWRTSTGYLWVLCAAVVVGAAYLFGMYLVAMRNVRYANR